MVRATLSVGCIEGSVVVRDAGAQPGRCQKEILPG